MKKSHYFAALAIGAMALASCSNDDVISSVDEPGTIGFKAMANKAGRSGDVETNNIVRFRVFGCTMDAGATTNHTTLFDNVTVSRPNTSSTDWTYSDTQYWAENKDYYFVAISTNNETPTWTYTMPTTHPVALTADANFKGYGTIGMSIGDVNADRDLVFAAAARKQSSTIDQSKVAFSFSHMLSRIAVTFKNVISNDDYSLVISNIKISNLYNAGTIDLGADTPAWTTTDNTTVQISATVPSNNKLTKNSTTQTDHKFIIPTNQTITIEFDVEVRLNDMPYTKRTLTGTIATQDYVWAQAICSLPK